MPKEQYRVAIVGMGSIARAHVKAMSQTDRVNLVAACDVSQNSIDRFKSQFKIEHTYLDIDQMLAEEDIDIVIICTWGKFHESVGRQIAQSRCPRAILCEKPFTQTAEEAVRLVEAAEDNGVLIAEAFKFRHHPMHLKAKELLSSGVIGSPRSVLSTFCWGSGAPLSARKPELNWRYSQEKGGGSIYDLACYNIHHARWIFGENAIEVIATQRPGLEVDDGADIQLIFPDNGIAQITVGFDAWRSQKFNILGTKGSIEADLAWNNENIPVELQYNSKDKTDLFHFAPVNQFILQIEHLCDVLDGTTDHRIPPLDSINQMRTIDAIYESFETRRAVTI